MLNGLYAQLLADGRKNQAGGGLSARSVRYIHTIIHRLLKDAVRWGRLARDAADAADPPRSASSHTEMVTWTGEETGRFLAGVRDDRLAAAFVLLATTGARRGEVLGLRWSDVDLDAGRAAIAVHHRVQLGEPKTARGRRTIDLDAMTVIAHREHRKHQVAERLLMGAGWTDQGLVFCRVDGGPLHPERFTRTFRDRVRQLGLPPIRLHDLRHGWATLALASGVHPKVVQERLGHATIGVTLDIYSRVTARMQSDAAEQVAAATFGGADSVG
jgi:integrase